MELSKVKRMLDKKLNVCNCFVLKSMFKTEKSMPFIFKTILSVPNYYFSLIPLFSGYSCLFIMSIMYRV